MKDYSGDTPLQLLVRDPHIFNAEIIDLLVTYGAQNIDIRDAEGRTPLQMAVERGNAQAVKKLVDHGADVSVVEADETDARRLKRLKNKAEKLTESHPKSQKILRQTTPSSTYTTEEIEEQAEAEQRKTLAVRHHKKKATTSSRTNRCVMA